MASSRSSLCRPFSPLQTLPNFQDLDKPNFVFSSDIPAKVISVVDNYFSHIYYQHIVSEDVVDLADQIIEFNINIELNTLLMRNKSLRPTDLIKEKLIYLAKSSKRAEHPSLKPSTVPNVSRQPASPAPSATMGSLYKFATKETFIVSLSLKLLDFIISIKDLDSFRIDFLKDENYGLLVLCDFNLIEQLELYIKKRFVKEIKSHLVSHASPNARYKARVDSSSTAVDSSDNEPLSPTCSAHHEDASTVIEGLPPVSHSVSINDDTIDKLMENRHNQEHLSSKSFLYDHDDYDSSLEEMITLKSNETTRTNATCNDDDNNNTNNDTNNNPTDYNNIFTDNLLSGLSNANYLSNTNLKLRTKLTQLRRQYKEDGFIRDVNNLRHNDTNSSFDNYNRDDVDLDDFDNLEASLDLEASLNSINDDDFDSISKNNTPPHHIIDQQHQQSLNRAKREANFAASKQQLTLKPPADLKHDMNCESSAYRLQDTPCVSPTKSLTRQHSQGSPKTPSKTPTLRRSSTATFSFINTEDNEELEYAFKDKSPLVPSFIKENKKFKFIKVGKVQKFVNLFEEKMTEDKSGTSDGSRTTTRPSSPLKKERKY